MKTIATVLFFALSIPLLFSQTTESPKVITLLNPSFEDKPQVGKTPESWQNCGFLGETPPDIQPEPTFMVTAKPQHGKTYLGMVVRDNDTWEKVGQKLVSPIAANQCYQFSIYLMRSELYCSRSQLTYGIANYVTPAKLIIWGGNEFCAKAERLMESAVIKNFLWEKHTFTFKTEASHQYILFEVFYQTPILLPYNGNILVDNASDFIPISCNSTKYPLQTITQNPRSVIDAERRNMLQAAKKKGIIYYTSALTPEEEAAVLQEIDDYLKTKPPYRARIYITGKSRKQGKKSKEHLEEKLTAIGWNTYHFKIEVLEGQGIN